MTGENRKKEINEAIWAGERALRSLRMAEEKLSSARNWGLLDMFGGGLATNLIKHSKINDASSYIEEAKRDLCIFQKELRDIPNYGELKIDIGGFLSFADFFFDGLLVDYMVQSKINDARYKVHGAVNRVEMLLAELKSLG